MPDSIPPSPRTLAALRESGWSSRSVKEEVRANFLGALAAGAELFPGIIGYDDTVIPEIDIAIIAGHDMLFLGEKGQAKSRLMRLLARFLDEWIPYLDDPAIPLHDDPYRTITSAGKALVAGRRDEEVPIAWWHRSSRYVERLAPGTKFADIIGEIDPSKLASGTSMASEEALYLGLIPRMHRGMFAMNELPELDDDVASEEVEALAEQMLGRLAVTEKRPRVLDPHDLPGGKPVFVVGVALILLLVSLAALAGQAGAQVHIEAAALAPGALLPA